jgi:hypothetical protein
MLLTKPEDGQLLSNLAPISLPPQSTAAATANQRTNNKSKEEEKKRTRLYAK